MANLIHSTIIFTSLIFGFVPTNTEVYQKPPELTLNQKIELLAIEYKQDPKVAMAIIACESKNNAKAIGTLAVVGKDYGYFQINSYFHEEEAKRLGFDIYNPDQNLEYGFYLMQKEGLSPWKSSYYCWKNKVVV